MLNYESMVTRQRKWMLYLLAILVLGLGFTSYTDIFLGLLLGSVISFYNLWILQRKINDFADNVIKRKRSKGLGTLSRLAAVAFGVIIALRFKENIHMIAFIIGLMTAYPIILIDFIMGKNHR